MEILRHGNEDGGPILDDVVGQFLECPGKPGRGHPLLLARIHEIQQVEFEDDFLVTGIEIAPRVQHQAEERVRLGFGEIGPIPDTRVDKRLEIQAGRRENLEIGLGAGRIGDLAKMTGGTGFEAAYAHAAVGIGAVTGAAASPGLRSPASRTPRNAG